jgi:hypothetical protein
MQQYWYQFASLIGAALDVGQAASLLLVRQRRMAASTRMWMADGCATGDRHGLERLFTKAEKSGLHGLCLADTYFDHVDFGRANLAGSVFDRVSLVGCDFRGATLACATFRGCDLRDARFDRGTLFRGSRFDGSNLLGARGLCREARSLVGKTGGILTASALA